MVSTTTVTTNTYSDAATTLAQVPGYYKDGSGNLKLEFRKDPADPTKIKETLLIGVAGTVTSDSTDLFGATTHTVTTQTYDIFGGQGRVTLSDSTTTTTNIDGTPSTAEAPRTSSYVLADGEFLDGTGTTTTTTTDLFGTETTNTVTEEYDPVGTGKAPKMRGRGPTRRWKAWTG